jgi:hypothetical protein
MACSCGGSSLSYPLSAEIESKTWIEIELSSAWREAGRPGSRLVCVEIPLTVGCRKDTAPLIRKTERVRW